MYPAICGGERQRSGLAKQNRRDLLTDLTLLRNRLEAMMAISSQIRLFVSKSRVSFG